MAVVTWAELDVECGFAIAFVAGRRQPDRHGRVAHSQTENRIARSSRTFGCRITKNDRGWDKMWVRISVDLFSFRFESDPLGALG